MSLFEGSEVVLSQVTVVQKVQLYGVLICLLIESTGFLGEALVTNAYYGHIML